MHSPPPPPTTTLVLDYVGQKAECLDLKQALENWERKLEIMEMAAKRARSVRRMQRSQGGGGNPALTM